MQLLGGEAESASSLGKRTPGKRGEKGNKRNNWLWIDSLEKTLQKWIGGRGGGWEKANVTTTVWAGISKSNERPRNGLKGGTSNLNDSTPSRVGDEKAKGQPPENKTEMIVLIKNRGQGVGNRDRRRSRPGINER